jgi:hypothetical protein
MSLIKKTDKRKNEGKLNKQKNEPVDIDATHDKNGFKNLIPVERFWSEEKDKEEKYT